MRIRFVYNNLCFAGYLYLSDSLPSSAYDLGTNSLRNISFISLDKWLTGHHVLDHSLSHPQALHCAFHNTSPIWRLSVLLVKSYSCRCCVFYAFYCRATSAYYCRDKILGYRNFQSHKTMRVMPLCFSIFIPFVLHRSNVKFLSNTEQILNGEFFAKFDWWMYLFD